MELVVAIEMNAKKYVFIGEEKEEYENEYNYGVYVSSSKCRRRRWGQGITWFYLLHWRGLEEGTLGFIKELFYWYRRYCTVHA